MKDEKNMEFMPDQKLHRTISFIKSAIRILGCLALIGNITLGAVLIAIAEVVGVIEEIV